MVDAHHRGADQSPIARVDLVVTLTVLAIRLHPGAGSKARGRCRIGVPVHAGTDPGQHGRAGGNLRTHEWLEIKPAKAKVQLAYLPHSDFYRVLRQKLKWSGASM